MSKRRHAAIGHMWGWHRRLVYSSLSLCGATGLLWFVMREIVAIRTNFDHLILVIHGVSAYVVVLAIGSVLTTHVRAAWRARVNRKSGGVALGVLSFLSLSALFLYYGSEALHDMSKWAHVVLGLAAVVAFPLHIIIGRAAHNKKQRDSSGAR